MPTEISNINTHIEVMLDYAMYEASANACIDEALDIYSAISCLNQLKESLDDTAANANKINMIQGL